MLAMIPFIAYFCTTATTIIPYANLGALVQEAPIVVIAQAVNDFEHLDGGMVYYRTSHLVKEVIKGSLQVGENFTTEKWKMKIGDIVRIMYGDLQFEEGETYLMFLSPRDDGFYQPICFSYYLFKEISYNDDLLWQPSSKEKEFTLSARGAFEPLYYFDRAKLVTHLRNVASGSTVWNSRLVVSNLVVFPTEKYTDREAPNHCGYIQSSSQGMRWTNFPDVPLPVHYQSGGDSQCASSVDFVKGAIDSINRHYLGVNLTDGGSFSGYVPDCAGGVIGSDHTDFVQAQWGSSRHITVQFNDPCDAIGNLSGCSGTLAVGGLYGVGSHQYDGQTWFTGAYGYVVVNNGVGGCLCTAQEFSSLLTHEISHTMGLDHISSTNGAANMNAFCCNDIESLDINCVEYLYQPSILLPVELLSFDGTIEGQNNHLSWKTANEVDVERFVIEKAIEPAQLHFEQVGEVLPLHTEDPIKEYLMIDYQPNAKSYYRLRIIDLDGTEEYSQVNFLEREVPDETQIFPTMTQGPINFRFGKGVTESVNILVTDLSGRIIHQTTVSGEIAEINISDVPSGTYLVTAGELGNLSTQKVTKF